MRLNIPISGLLLLSLILSGCSPEEVPKVPGVYVGTPARLMSDLKKNDVFLRVNGQRFTKADFLVAVSMQDKLRRMCAGDPLTGRNRPAEEYSMWVRPRTLSEVLRHALIRQYAAKIGVKATKEEFDAYVNALLPKLHRKGRALKSVAAEFGEKEGRLFISYVEDDVLAQPLRNHFDTEHTLQITDEDIVAVSNRIVRFQANAAASNAVEHAALEAAMAEIKAGADFAAVAKKYSEVPEEGEYWGEYFLEEISENPRLVEWVKTAKPNDVSGILELDDGISIVKVLERHLEDVPAGQEYEERHEVWRLVRIARRFFETTDDMTRPEIIQMLTNYRNKKIQKKVGEAIMKEAVVEWPHGTNLFQRAKAQNLRPAVTPQKKKGTEK